MISTNDYLSQLMEEIPQWLADYRPGDRVSFSDFMSGRVGYYPGSGLDGHLVKVGGMSHSVHCFLYVDYLETREHIVRELAVNGFRGYHSIGRIDFSEEDMYPHGHHQLDVDIDLSGRISSMIPGAKPYCFMEILERNADKNDSWGAERLAVTFLFADGIMTYYDLFSREYGRLLGYFCSRNMASEVTGTDSGMAVPWRRLHWRRTRCLRSCCVPTTPTHGADTVS